MTRPRFAGRRKPYTVRGIRRRRCIRCGVPAAYQWSACANGNRWVPLCEGCDIELNELALTFLRIPHAAALMRHYRESLERSFPDMGG
jgi:hypothetical protein